MSHNLTVQVVRDCVCYLFKTWDKNAKGPCVPIECVVCVLVCSSFVCLFALRLHLFYLRLVCVLVRVCLRYVFVLYMCLFTNCLLLYMSITYVCVSRNAHASGMRVYACVHMSLVVVYVCLCVCVREIDRCPYTYLPYVAGVISPCQMFCQ